MANNTRQQGRADARIIAGLTPAQRAAMLRYAASIARTTPRADEAPILEYWLWHERGVLDAATALEDAAVKAATPPPPRLPSRSAEWIKIRINQTIQAR